MEVGDVYAFLITSSLYVLSPCHQPRLSARLERYPQAGALGDTYLSAAGVTFLWRDSLALTTRPEGVGGMTWKMKLPQPPRKRYTARDIAADLGVGVAEVRDALKAVGEFVRSDQTREIEEPVKRKVAEHLGITYELPASHTPSPWQHKDQGGPGKVRRRPGPPPGWFGPNDYKDLTVSSPPRAVGISDPSQDASAAMEDSAWTYYGFTLSERDLWCEHLRPGEAKVAAQLRDAGLVPDDLAINVGGWTVKKRLRAGEPLAEVKRLLERHRSAG